MSFKLSDALKLFYTKSNAFFVGIKVFNFYMFSNNY